MPFQTNLNNLISRYRRAWTVVCSLLLVALIGTAAIVHADQFDNQISALQQQNSANQSQLSSLEMQASSYQDAINQLQGQISALESAMAANQAKQNQLQQQIAANEQEIATKKSQLSADVKTMYIDGQMTTIEELASSNNLSDYIDKEEYRTTVQNQLNAKISEINKLQAELQLQKQQLQIVINTEKQQDNQLLASQAQQQQLMSYNQSQQDVFNQKIKSNQAQIASLRAQQAAANKHLGNGTVQTFGACGGSYPSDAISPYGHWGCNYYQDNTFDNWGLYNRECVSYAAWMVYHTYGYMPYWGGRGNAIQWIGNAQSAGIPTGKTPKAGSVAIWPVGYYGHAMWVDSVNGDGSINVQQYNYSYDGTYSTMTIKNSSLTYIYFGG